MNKSKIAAMMVLMMGVAGTATAGNGFYAGLGVGQASIDLCGDAYAAGATSCDDSDTGWKIVGGYQATDNLSFEASWVDLGEVSASSGGVTVGAEGDGFVANVKGLLPINGEFGVFAKLGFIRWNADGTGVLSGLGDDGTDLAFGAGVQYMFSDQLGVVGEWDRYDFDGDDVDLLSIGALVYF